MGFDWLEAGFAKPVAATEVRDAQGQWHTVWSGLSDVKEDKRGSHTWFLRSFEKTPYRANAVKVTIVNNVERGYKVVDAVQLVGE